MRGETSLIEQSFYQKERVARKGRMGEEGLGTAKSKAISHPLKGDCFLPLNSPKICGFVISQAGEDMCPPSPHSSCTFPKILKEPSALPPHLDLMDMPTCQNKATQPTETSLKCPHGGVLPASPSVQQLETQVRRTGFQS